MKRMEFWDHMDCQWSQQNIFEHFENLKKNYFKKHKFAHISATVRDRMQQTIVGDNMNCRCSQQHFSTFQNQKLLSLETVGDRAKTIEIWDFF